VSRQETLARRPSLLPARSPAIEPASRKELCTLGVYFAVTVLAADVLNVRLGVELMTVVVVLAAAFIARSFVAFCRDWWVFLLGLLLWNLSGPVAAQSTFPQHLGFMLNLDRLLFLGHQPVSWIQHHLATMGKVGPLDVLAAALYNMHLPEPYIAGFFLWRLQRAVFFQFVAASLLLLVLGFVTFILFPAVPPWLAGEPLRYVGNQYVVSAGGHTYLPGAFNGFGPVLHNHPLPFHGTPIFYLFHFVGDRVAAFPSEHAAFPLLECLAFACVSRRVAAGLAIWVLLIFGMILYLGEHWVTDALAGYVYAVAIWSGVRLVARTGYR